MRFNNRVRDKWKNIIIKTTRNIELRLGRGEDGMTTQGMMRGWNDNPRDEERME